MKTKFLFIFLLAILSLSLVSSVEISMKNQVDLGENFVVKISGNFYQPLTKDNIKFYRKGYLPTTMSPLGFTKINGDYFFFLDIPTEKIPDNYTLEIPNVKYYEGGNLIMGTIKKDFTITNKTVPFRIYPSFITGKDDFNVSLENMLNHSIDVSTIKNTRSFEQMNLTGESVSSGSFLDVLFGKTNSTDNSTNSTYVNETTYNGTISINSGETKPINYPAPTKAGFETINFYYDGKAYGLLAYFPEDSIVINTNNETINSTNDTLTQNETLNQTNQTNETINSTNDTKNKTIEVNSNEQNCSALNLSDGGGVVPACNSTFVCNGSTVVTLTEKCCRGTCVVPEKSNTGKIVGWIIIGLLVVGTAWFVRKKYSKAGPSGGLFKKK